MPTLAFTIPLSGVAQVHELLVCLAKFDENVSLEATVDHLRISSLNISKTAHAAFTLDASSFFAKYQCIPDYSGSGAAKGTWTCRLQNRALLSIFKRRMVDQRDKDTALERCEIELEARDDQTECRLIVRMICRHGVIKTSRLTYESGEVLNATFDGTKSENYWTISSKTLRDVVEYFGPKTDQLDWYFKDDKVTFTSYTDKIQNGREILKQPMHTSVALERKDFDDFNVQQGLHIGIVVKDFRAIIAHAETMQVNITARYSRGNRPMQLVSELDGITSEFTLMTRGHSADVPSGSTTSTPARDLSVRPISHAARSDGAASNPATTQSAPAMGPPISIPKPAKASLTSPSTGRDPRNSPPAPSASINPNSLFIPDANDQQWDEPDYGDEPDIVMWDNASDLPSASNSFRRIRDSEPTSFRSIPDRRIADVEGIAPTQRLSQVRGLFD